MEPLLPAGKNVCINGLGHMTKISAMPISGKTFIQSSEKEVK